MSPQRLHDLYAGFAPWLALALILLGRNPHLSRTRIVGSLLMSFFLLRIPVAGWSGFAWFRTLEMNPSFTLTALLAIALWGRVAREKLFRTAEWNAAWIVGSGLALLLYPMGLGLTSIDPYRWGWGPGLPILTAVIAAILMIRGNRFGIVLLLPFAGFAVGLQESTNFWDAASDPFYAIISILAVLRTAFRNVKSVALTSSGGIVNGQTETIR